eukprot:1161463-Pelagomonas_calceolata.AAC.8
MLLRKASSPPHKHTCFVHQLVHCTHDSISVFPPQHTRPNDDGWCVGGLELFQEGVPAGQELRQCGRIGAQVLVLVGQVDVLADGGDLQEKVRVTCRSGRRSRRWRRSAGEGASYL